MHLIFFFDWSVKAILSILSETDWYTLIGHLLYTFNPYS